MDYVFSNKGLMLSIILPMVFIIIIFVEKIKNMKKRKKVVFIVSYYMIGIITETLFFICNFDIYFCYVYFLIILLGYPILSLFAKKGNEINSDLPNLEKSLYKKYLSTLVLIFGVIVMLFAICNLAFDVYDFELKGKMLILSKCIYLILGIICIFNGMFTKFKADVI